MTLDNVKYNLAKIYIDLTCLYVDNSISKRKFYNILNNKEQTDDDIVKYLLYSINDISNDQRVVFLNNVAKDYYKDNEKNNNCISYYEKIPNEIIANELRKNLLLIELNFHKRLVENMLWAIHLICYKVHGYLDMILLEYLSTQQVDRLVINDDYGDLEYYDLSQFIISGILKNNNITRTNIEYKDEEIQTFYSYPIKDVKDMISGYKEDSKLNWNKIKKIVIEIDFDNIYISKKENEVSIIRY